MDYEIFVSGDNVIVPGIIDTPMTREDALRLADVIRSALAPTLARRTHREWTADDCAELRRRYESGEPVKAIAVAMNRTGGAVKKKIFDFGISNRLPTTAAAVRRRHAAAKAAAE